MAGPSRQFGLLLPKKAQLSAPKKGNIFGDDSDLDEDDGVDWVKKSLQAESEKNRVKKQARIDAERALEEDPTIYQYDEIYSKIHVDPKQKKAEKKKEGPKYIKTLLQAAEMRKKEHELRIERMVQKEREAEGEMFKDKEKFVTASYRAKLEEMKKLEEEQKEMDRLETIGDVTKQGDVSGFYRHLYEQTFDKAKTDVTKEPVSRESEIKKESEEEKIEKPDENLDKDDSSVNDSSSNEECGENKKEAVKILKRTRKVKQFRQRVVEDLESEDEDDKGKEKNGKEEKEKEDTKYKEDRLEDKNDSGKEKKEDKNIRKRSLTPEVKEKNKENKDKIKEELQNGSSKKKKEDEEKPKQKKAERRVSIWEKRTVGPVFNDALQRYYARKATRVSGS